MLAHMMFESNEKPEYGISTEVETREENGEVLSLVKTYADTSNDWWKEYKNEGDKILVGFSSEEKRGIWFNNGANFDSDIEESTNINLKKSYINLLNDGTVLDDIQLNLHNLDKCVSSYMVCDDIEQALEYWKFAVEHPTNEFLISMMPVRKKDQPERDGWRWHKWGPYIGTQNPKHEYLYDESDEINLVFCAMIYLVESK